MRDSLADPNDRGDQNTRRGLKTDHATWQQWLDLRQRNGLDVATITDWNVSDRVARCRTDLTKANPASKCKQWTREFVWLANQHLIVLDVVETPKPAIRAQWQLHLPQAPHFGGGWLSVTNQAPAKAWADDSLRPKHAVGRLFCQTLLPQDCTRVLHAGGRAEPFDPAGHSKGNAPANAHHSKFGKQVVQIEPSVVSLTSRRIGRSVLPCGRARG